MMTGGATAGVVGGGATSKGFAGVIGVKGTSDGEGVSDVSIGGTVVVSVGATMAGHARSAGAESQPLVSAGAQGAAATQGTAGVQGTAGAQGTDVSQAGTTRLLGSQSTTEQVSADGLQPSRCSSLSIQRPAETGLNVTSVHSVAINASRTQYVNGLDMNPTPL